MLWVFFFRLKTTMWWKTCSSCSKKRMSNEWRNTMPRSEFKLGFAAIAFASTCDFCTPPPRKSSQLSACLRREKGWFRIKFNSIILFRYFVKVKEALVQRKEAEAHKAAAKIQKIWRGYYTRKYIHNYYARRDYLFVSGSHFLFWLYPILGSWRAKYRSQRAAGKIRAESKGNQRTRRTTEARRRKNPTW